MSDYSMGCLMILFLSMGKKEELGTSLRIKILQTVISSLMGQMGSELCHLKAQGERGPFKPRVPSDMLG